MTIEVVREDGVTVKASYQSSKDVAAPSFMLQRDETGQIESIQIGAEGAASSPVVDANANMLGTVVGSAVSAGVQAAKRP